MDLGSGLNCLGLEAISPPGTYRIQSSTFDIYLTDSAVKGGFVSETEARGYYSYHAAWPSVCGDYITWTARKESQATYKRGWNMVAGPGGTTFPQSNPTLYTSQGNGGYEGLTNSQGVTEGWGYWAYFASDTTMTITQAGSSSYSTTLVAGQRKMVGNPSGTANATVKADKIYTYDPQSGYSVSFGSTTLAVGQGAWVYSAAGGSATVTAH